MPIKARTEELGRSKKHMGEIAVGIAFPNSENEPPSSQSSRRKIN
jgi:hypothetical protein